MPVHRLRGCILIVTLLTLHAPGEAAAQDAGRLPVISLEVDQKDLASLFHNPWADVRVPVRLAVDSSAFDGTIQMHGGTSRGMPKPSFRVRLGSDENAFGRKVLVFRAEYRDRTYMRNYLMHRLFERLGFLAPESRFVRLHLNGEDAGVYLQVERINDDFLDARDLPRGDVFSLELNAGRWYPYMHHADFLTGWNGQVLTADAQRRAEYLLMQLGHADYDDFRQLVESRFDVDEVLLYYAVVYATMSRDAVADNHYVYRHPESGRLQFIPWDMDASLGTAYDGSYAPENETARDWGFFHSNLLQRMLEYPDWQEVFLEKVDLVAEEGFAVLQEEAERARERIQADVYVDPTTGADSLRFQKGVAELLGFLEARRESLREHAPVQRTALREVRVSNPFPAPDRASVVVEAYAGEAIDLSLWLSYDFRFTEWSSTRRDENVRMNDEGIDGDREAGDGWYACTVDLSPYVGDIVAVGFRQGIWYAPPATVYNAHFRPSASWAFNLKGNTRADYERLTFDATVRVGGDTYVTLHNPGESPVDLSGFYFQAGPYFQRVAIPWGTVLAPAQSLVVASNVDGARLRYPEAVVTGGMAFDLAPDDTLRLMSPMQTVFLASLPESVAENLPRVVISEINYKSSPELDTGDWVELYNAEDEAVVLEGWQIRDGEDDHVFVFPEDAVLEAGAFALVAADHDRLRASMEVYGDVYGDLGFGLDGAGELVRVLNEAGELVTSIRYDDKDPWPTEPDGDGHTLELIAPGLVPEGPENWQASAIPGGSPGRRNSGWPTSTPMMPWHAFELRQPYPNPARDQVTIEVSMPTSQQAVLVLYDILGRERGRVQVAPWSNTVGVATIALRDLPAGMYFVYAELRGQRSAVKRFVHVR